MNLKIELRVDLKIELEDPRFKKLSDYLVKCLMPKDNASAIWILSVYFAADVLIFLLASSDFTLFAVQFEGKTHFVHLMKSL